MWRSLELRPAAFHYRDGPADPDLSRGSAGLKEKRDIAPFSFFYFYARIAQRAYAPKGWKALGPQGSNPKWSVDQPKVGFTHRVVYPDRRLEGFVIRCGEMRESKKLCVYRKVSAQKLKTGKSRVGPVGRDACRPWKERPEAGLRDTR